jgi:hypothetical protein
MAYTGRGAQDVDGSSATTVRIRIRPPPNRIQRTLEPCGLTAAPFTAAVLFTSADTPRYPLKLLFAVDAVP